LPHRNNFYDNVQHPKRKKKWAYHSTGFIKDSLDIKETEVGMGIELHFPLHIRGFNTEENIFPRIPI